MEYHRSGRWGQDPIGEEWDTASHEATVNVQRYRVRVADAEVRQAVEHVVKLAATANQGAAYGENDRQAYARAAAAFQDALPAYERTQELIGERLRGLA
jgi:hypothetical protein